MSLCLADDIVLEQKMANNVRSTKNGVCLKNLSGSIVHTLKMSPNSVKELFIHLAKFPP